MRFRRPYGEEPEVNLIPLIDVLLIVLIFLAVSTTYSRFAELKIQLPSADATTPATPPQVINVAVTADGRYALGGEKGQSLMASTDSGDLAAVLTRLVQGREDVLLVINADAQFAAPVGDQRDGSSADRRHRAHQLRDAAQSGASLTGALARCGR